MAASPRWGGLLLPTCAYFSARFLGAGLPFRIIAVLRYSSRTAHRGVELADLEAPVLPPSVWVDGMTNEATAPGVGQQFAPADAQVLGCDLRTDIWFKRIGSE